MRRIKNVTLTIPCVTGPYTSVNCTLTLVQSRTRLTNTAGSSNRYPEHPAGSDPRFAYDFAATDSIATSTAQNDSGMFEVNFRDERYLPFEGAGAVSQWRLVMPADCNAFDFETITDVILNLRYTARNGGDALNERRQDPAALRLPPSAGYSTAPPAGGTPAVFPKNQINLLRYFSLRHEYPTEWYKFLHPPTGGTAASASMQINLGRERFPFQYRRSTITINQAEIIVVPKTAAPSSGSVAPQGAGSAPSSFSLTIPTAPPTAPPQPVSLTQQPGPAQPGQPMCFYTKSPPAPASPPQGGPVTWVLASSGGDPSQVFDIFLVCQYSANFAA